MFFYQLRSHLKAVLTSYNHHRNSSTRTFTFRIVRLHNESVLCVVKKPCYRVVVPICLCKESEFTARTFIDIVALWKKNLGQCFFSFVFVYVNVLINKRHTQNISMSVLQKSELGNVVKQKGVDVASTTGTIIITIIIIIIIFFSMTTMLTIKILFTINSLEKRKNYLFKTLFTIPVDLKST